MSGLELLGWAWPEIGAAFALTAAALVVLYLVRLRRRVVTVPWIALFRDALPDQRTTSFFTRLKNLLSLLLVLIVAALIALALGQPRLAEEEDDARTLVIVIDASASMQARLAIDAPTTRFDRARDAALARLATLGPEDRAIVLAAGAHARVVHPM
ncbi:MAG: BatA domain-containing protein, partial [Deltaproteobacteria bacterium]|nr:BatA domain-containing protein [Deltaproteobacteria bacterium]